MFSFVSIIVILILTSFIGRIFSYRILRPVIDITKIAQETISHEDLDKRVKTEHMDEEMKYLTAAFNDMISRLSKSFEYIVDFSSNVAHELKTPIAIMIGEAELSLRRDQTVEEYKRVLNVNLEESKRILKTIEDLLLLTKLDFRSAIFNFENFDLIIFLEEIYAQTRVLARPKEINVSKNFPKKEILVKADRVHLRRLFFNLISNAIKFNRIKGSVKFEVNEINNNIEISIIDTGIGISDKDKDRIFDKFFHNDNKFSPEEQGNGLGLSIALAISKIHKGDIVFESAHGKGSHFKVILPVSR